LDNRQLRKRGGGLFGSNPLTGSIGVVTINLPRIGYLSKNIQEFYQRLEKLMILAKESLVIKREIIEKYTEEGLYPYTKFYLRSVKQKFGKYWSNHFSTIGLVGLNEALLNFNGEDLTSKKGQEMGNQILQFMRDKIFEFQEETKEMFNLEATPAEGTAYRLAKLDQMKFNSQAQSELALTNLRGYNSNKAKKLIFGNQVAVEESGAEPYYTNSSQLPVYFTEDIFTALDLQDELQSKYTGGTVLHGFLGEKINDIATVKKLVKTIATNYKLPYFTLTPTFSICPKHGYISGEHDNCPRCQSECEVYSRVVGYIRPVKQWNKGKQQEFADRLEYKVTE
jgi:ribonucleoside-triphosphate reductase